MTLYGIILDKWAVGERTRRATIAIQSICLIISLSLLFIRSYHIYQNRQALLNKKKALTLQLSQWIMTVFSCLYLFFHDWNYIHLYLPTNGMDCAAWWIIALTSFTSTRVFLFIFLTLRSSYTFEDTVFELSKKICYTFIAITVILNYGSLCLMFTDFTPISPFPDKGFCFRTIGPQATIGINILHGSNCLLSIIAVVLFYWKARMVKKAFATHQENGKMDASLLELNYQFTKHIKLGIITVTGTIILFVLLDMLSVMKGITGALDQVTNNILTFIMFKESARYYRILLCRKKQVKNRQNIIQMTKSISVSNGTGTDIEAGNNDNPDANIVAVLH